MNNQTEYLELSDGYYFEGDNKAELIESMVLYYQYEKERMREIEWNLENQIGQEETRKLLEDA